MDDKITQKKSDFLKALAHPTRLNILQSLREGERCVCEIIELVDAEQSNTSQHLSILKKKNILTSRKEGLKVIYRIKDDKIFLLLNLLEQLIASQMEESMDILENLKKRQMDANSGSRYLNPPHGS
ncbi:MAG TPA: ArsR family transcriptional regulator [Syntrophomonas wolfei]|uniref:ArsR family transcriptional regulator n=1 Tax=Syntrophomonas wolfei TaxID=863 RepID=A0A354YUQ7_9FIRM|nr:ArsR family transcriptional regulator [Syntrophomonas wolfei]